MAERPDPLPDEEHNRWFTPAEALLALEPLKRSQAAILLQEGARTELIRTSAKSFFCEPRNYPGFLLAEYANIPAYYWAHLSQQSQMMGFWDTGLARMWFGNTPYFTIPTAVRCADVRFNREDVEKAKPPIPRQLLAKALIESTPAATTPGLRARHPGGAPPKDIWERVWIEIAARLYSGDLKPEKQKDIEQAIMAIAMSLGDEIGEATARRHAKPLWDKIKSGS